MKLSVYKFGDVEKTSDLKVSENIFAVSVANDMLLEVIRYQRAKRRAGTADVKNRSEVRCSRKKIYRQKGTGGARHGAKSAPIFVGGGVAFGPTPRSFEFKLNKKFRLKALKGALSLKVSDNRFKLVDGFDISSISTKDIKQRLCKHTENDANKVLIIDSDIDPKLSSSCANLHNCKVLPVSAINVYDLINHDLVIMSVEAVKKIEERFNV